MAGGTGSPAHLLLRGIGFLVPYATVALWRAMDCLYILQLERYDPDRYRTWVRRHRAGLVPRPEVVLQLVTVAAIVALAGAGLPWPILWGVWLLLGLPCLRGYRSLQVSQRLQWTARAVRVALAVGGIAGILLCAIVGALRSLAPQAPLGAWLPAGAIVGLALVGGRMPALVFWAAAAAAPLERRIARRFTAEAAARMRRYPGRILGITGSYGKTTTKHIVAELLAARYRVFKTPAGVNTTMGIVRTIREELTDEAEVFVVEMSAYGPGEIREVCALTPPTLGILTAVGVQHLERFGTPERIAEAKYELIAALPAGAPAILNAEDPVCLRLAERARAEGKRVRLYGFADSQGALAVRGGDVTVSGAGSRFTVRTDAGEGVTVETRLLGHWNLSNILAAIAAAIEWGIPLEALREPIARLWPAPRRLEIQTEGGITRILDVANANPRGAAMALEVLGQFAGGSRILVTPGMVELGPLEAEENRRFGELAAAVCDYVVLVGPEQTRPIREGLLSRHFPADRLLLARHAGDVADLLGPIVRPGDVLLYENRLPDTYLEVAA